MSSTWQWRADGTDIPGATSATYTVQPGDVGKTLEPGRAPHRDRLPGDDARLGRDRGRPGAGIADGDQAIPPDAQRQFAPRMGATSVEIATNHVAMVSHPDDVLQLIKKAAGAASR